MSDSFVTPCNPPASLPISQARVLEWAAISLSGGWFVGGLPNPGIKSKSPALQANSLLLNYTDDQSSSRVRLLEILPGSSVLGISQARILEWVAISSSRGFPTQGLNPGWSVSSVLQADSLPLSQWGSPDRQIEVKVDTVRDN